MPRTRRSAGSDDMETLFDISKRALRESVEKNFGRWDEEDQRAMFFRSTDPATHELLFEKEVPIGFLWVERAEEAIHLHRISIVPEFQNKGIGTGLIRELIRESEETGLPLKLRVFPDNPARRLYERLGFRESYRSGTHVFMIWKTSHG